MCIILSSFDEVKHVELALEDVSQSILLPDRSSRDVIEDDPLVCVTQNLLLNKKHEITAS